MGSPARLICVAILLLFIPIAGCQKPQKRTGKVQVSESTAPLIAGAATAAATHAAAEARNDDRRSGRDDKPEPVITRTYDIRHLTADIGNFSPPRKYLDPDGASHRGDQALFEEDEESVQMSQEERTELVLLHARNHVDPDNWRDNGGLVSSMTEYEGLLIVTTTARNHAHLQELFTEIARNRRRQVEIAVATYDIPAVAAQRLLAQGTVLEADGARQLITSLAGVEGAIRVASSQTICANGQTVYVMDTGVRMRRESEPVVGAQIAAHDADYEPALDGNRPGAITSFRPILDPDTGAVHLTIAADVVRPIAVAQRPALVGEMPDGDVLQTLDARLLQHRSTVRIPAGGAVVLVSSGEPADLNTARDTLTIIHARIIEQPAKTK